MPAPDTLEGRTQHIGRELLQAARAQRENPFSSRFWSDRLMRWALGDPAFRVQLFRFVDVFPTLRTSAEVHDYLVEYLSQPGVELPAALRAGLKVGGLAKGLLAKGIAQQIRAMASTFIAGADLADALPTIRRLWDSGIASSIDLLGEAVVSRDEAEAYGQRYLDLVRELPSYMQSWPAEPHLETDALGPLPRANVSIKLTALDAQVDAIDFAGTVDRLVDALRPILDAAPTMRHGRHLRYGTARDQGPDAGRLPPLLRGGGVHGRSSLAGLPDQRRHRR